ncbi:MAG: hypothetical protein NC093_01160 [Alistipes sp.]|nr:hypothetical protein [Alistipes sp.]
MKILKTLVMTAAADILALFIGMTLAGSSSELIRFISAVCTSGILMCILGSFAYKSAREDVKNQRAGIADRSPVTPWLMGLAASTPGIISWLILKFSSLDFYRWHKLINGWFLQIYNMINPNASSAALTPQQKMIMLPLAAVPTIVFMVGYFMGVHSEKKE